jgi:hypothetical protein
MATRKHQPESSTESVVALAVAAVEGSPSVVDMPMAGFDPSPGALDLPLKDQAKRCSRCGRPAVGRCPECGSPLCGDCVGYDVAS